jgi:hypothetical protein
LLSIYQTRLLHNQSLRLIKNACGRFLLHVQ